MGNKLVLWRFFSQNKSCGLEGSLDIEYTENIPTDNIFEDALLWLENSMYSVYLSITNLNTGERFVHVGGGKWEKRLDSCFEEGK